LTFEQIKELVELVSQRGLGSLEIERTGFRLRIDARPAPSVAASGDAARAIAAAEPAAAAGPAAPSPIAPPAATAAPAATSAEAHVLTSPIVGTFYSAPSPDSPPFVSVGARVRKGQVVCIVEAMKLMNEIESDVDGMVTEVFPRNAQPVEFGEPLFAIRES
jgi:acetyl-CoA carboxylase biotin carboxyl carrier protein